MRQYIDTNAAIVCFESEHSSALQDKEILKLELDCHYAGTVNTYLVFRKLG